MVNAVQMLSEHQKREDEREEAPCPADTCQGVDGLVGNMNGPSLWPQQSWLSFAT
jgi:hypothetical protein